MKKLMLSAAVVAMALGAASVSANAAADRFKACWIYIGSVGDFGWTYQHNEGTKLVEKTLGDKVEVVRVENVPEADSAGAIDAWPVMAAKSFSQHHSAIWSQL
jgi:basic membrane protein A and related proteins